MGPDEPIHHQPTLDSRAETPLGASPTVATDLPDGVQSPAALDQLKGGELPDTKGVG